MLKLEQLTPNASIRGIVPDALVSVVFVQWFGSDAIELTYKEPNGRVGNTLLYRDADAGRVSRKKSSPIWLDCLGPKCA